VPLNARVLTPEKGAYSRAVYGHNPDIVPCSYQHSPSSIVLGRKILWFPYYTTKRYYMQVI